MSDPKKARAVQDALEDRELGDVVAPVKKEDCKEASKNETKAKILGAKATEGKQAEMSRYNTKQMVKVLSD